MTVKKPCIGTLKWFDLRKGYGFVVFEEKDVFIHCDKGRVIDSASSEGVVFSGQLIPKNDERFGKDVIPRPQIAFILGQCAKGACADRWGFLP